MKANLTVEEKQKLCELLEIMVLHAKAGVALKNAALALAKREGVPAVPTDYLVDARALIRATHNGITGYMKAQGSLHARHPAWLGK